MKRNSQASLPDDGMEGIIPDIIYHIGEIDAEAGLRHCGTPEVYMETIRTFLNTAADNADEMEGYLQNNDMRSLTVKIHALKSTSRVIGAKELGALAETLEKAGNEGDYATLRGGIGKLLADYRELAERLTPIGPDESDGEKPEIDGETLKNAFEAILEFSEALDYDSIMYVIKSLGGYKIPDREKKRVDRLRNAALGFDYELIPGILKEIQ